MPIRPLSPLLVNQIAAGEVIERPASVVKELVENAIDAQATRVDVVIERGGRDLIRVSDDGQGIPLGELMLAISPHATSKIAVVEDLDAIGTMGFRGEALASIASVSRLSVLSRPRGLDSGGRVEVEAGQGDEPRPAGGAVGTTVTVANLFFNTPARRKFLRTDQTESARVTEVVQSLALAHPAIAFTLAVDGRTRLEVPATSVPRQRALAVLGPELEEELVEVRGEGGGIRLWGLAGRPGIARGTTRHIRVYLNGRPIADRAVTHAIREAYRGLIAPDRSPTIVLMLEIDPAQVDVNVHPAKAEVRFRQPSTVHRLVRGVLSEALAGADLVAEYHLPDRASSPPPAPFGSGGGAGAGGAGSAARTRQLLESFHQLDRSAKGFVYGEVKEALRAEAPDLLPAELVGPASERAAGHAAGHAMVTEEVSPPAAASVTEVLQVHERYLVTQDEQGMVIIDQHALHERVMFERIKQRLAAGNLEGQRLLMPATLEVDDEERLEDLQRLQPMLRRIGIEAEPIGPRAVAIHAFTSLLFERSVEPVAFLSDLLRRAPQLAADADPEAALQEVLDMMSCKAAIKAGDALTTEELQNLLRYREQVERSSRCPHGRPTTLRLSLDDLDRQFGRR
jgi:DNA mismatch repair protein MutL